MVWVELILSHVLNLKSWNTKHIQELRLQVSKDRLKNYTYRIIQNHEDLKKKKVDFSKLNISTNSAAFRWIEVYDSLHAQVW